MATYYSSNLIPDMTSNTAPSGTASASSELSSLYEPWKAMDRSTSSRWASSSAGVTPCWLQYEFASSVVIQKYTVKAYLTREANAPNTWTFEGYNGATWDTLDTQASITWVSGEKKEFTFSNSTSYTKYRIYITVNNGGSTTQIDEIEMMTGFDNTDTTDSSTEYTGTDEFGSVTKIIADDTSPTRTFKSGNYVERSDGKILMTYSDFTAKKIYVSWVDTEADLYTTDAILTNETEIRSFTNGELEEVYCKNLSYLFKTSTGKLLLFTYDDGGITESLPITVRVHESSNGLGTDFDSGTVIYQSDNLSAAVNIFSKRLFGLGIVQEFDGRIMLTAGGVVGPGTSPWTNYYFDTVEYIYSDDDGDNWSDTTAVTSYNRVLNVTYGFPVSGIAKCGNFLLMNVAYGSTNYLNRMYYSPDNGDNWYDSETVSTTGDIIRGLFTSTDGYSYIIYDNGTTNKVYRRDFNSAIDLSNVYTFGAGNEWSEVYRDTGIGDSSVREYMFESPSGNLIYSEEKSGTGAGIYFYTTDRTAVAGTTSDFLIEISGTDYTDKVNFDDASWTNVENFSNSASITVVDDSNFIKMGQELIIRRQSDSKVVFGGLIQEPKKILISPNFVMVKVYAENYKQILGRRTFQLSEQNTDAGTIVQGIFDDYLKVGGTFTDEGFVLGNIDTGATIENYVKRAQSGLKLFNDLADASDFKWWVTNTKDFYFQATPTYVDNTATKKLTPDKTDSAYIKCIDLPDLTEDSSKFRTRQNVVGKKIDGAYVFGSYTDSTAETEMASRYGSGVFGSVIVNDNITTTAEANALAQSEVETYVNPSKIRFKTTDFIEPLELITVDISILGISAETYKVTQVSYSFDNDVRIVCDVTCEKYQTTNKQKRAWTDEFNEMIKSNVAEGEQSDFTYIDNAGVVNLAPAVPYLSTLTHILDKDKALHCHYSIVGVSAGAGTVTVTFDINTVVQKTFTFDVVAGNFSYTFAYPIRGIATSGSATIDASTTSTVAVAIAINDLNFWVNNQ